MIQSEKPHDVYSTVAELVEKRRQKDAEAKVDNENNNNNNNNSKQQYHKSKIAKECEGFVKRQTIKRPVMTYCYGVTKHGARLQIEKELKEFPNFDRKYLKQASAYLADLTFDSIGELFKNSQKIQRWFEKCAKVMSNQLYQPVQWITPLGLPILQPYFGSKPLKSAKPVSIKGKKASYPNVDLPLVYKQKQAFPPNFIHSLDSTHMMLTALSCQRKGITYAMIHDCYWTHADTVDEMNTVCREEFVRLYNEPILKLLSDHFQSVMDECVQESPEALQEENKVFLPENEGTADDKHLQQIFDESVLKSGRIRKCLIKLELAMKEAKETLQEVPEQGDFDLGSIKNAKFFFS